MISMLVWTRVSNRPIRGIDKCILFQHGNPGQTATIVNDHIRVNTAVVTVFYRNTP